MSWNNVNHSCPETIPKEALVSWNNTKEALVSWNNAKEALVSWNNTKEDSCPAC